MLTRLATTVVHRRRLVLILTAAFLAIAGGVGGGVADKLSSGGFEDPNAESTRAGQLLEDELGAGSPNVVLLVTAKQGTVDDPAVAAAGAALTAELGAEPGLNGAASYWTLGNAPPLRSSDGKQALVLGQITGSQDDMVKRAETLTPAMEAKDNALIDVAVGGEARLFEEMGHTIESDLAKAESIAIPITLLLLVLVFGSVVAASLPLAIGVLSIMGTFLVLTILASMTDVSIFSLSLTTAMGLGLAIDYSLFIVSRFREELKRGLTTEAAVIRTVETAGRTVLFSAATVAISLAALLVFPLFFLRSFAYAGIAVVVVASIGAVVSLPALLAVLGPRVDKLSLFKSRRRETSEGFWHRTALIVMRRPLPVAVGVMALLLILGAPFLGATFGLPDDRVLPPDAPARQVSDALRAGFTSHEAEAVTVVAGSVEPGPARDAATTQYAAELSRVEGVARVDALTGSFIDGENVFPASPISARFARGDATWLSVVPQVEPVSPAGERLVKAVRAVPAPFEVLVGGPSARLVDSKASLFGRMPLAGLLIGLVTFTVLFLMFGSLLVPAKAVVLNLLSLSATFGAMVWIFQEGNLAGFFNFTPTGVLDTTTPILMFCVAFGLSMDYEVFLLSRIKEEHDKTGDNIRSVAMGLERTGRIVTAAAALLSVVFIAMATSGVSFIKLFGVGLTMAVLMDATLIRGALVPAFMRLAGEANWWAPGPLRRFHDRFGISESAGDDDVIDVPGVLDLDDSKDRLSTSGRRP